MNEYIRYNDESMVIDGVEHLTKGKVYKLSSKWPTGLNINDHWVFYIYDNIEDGDFRGYEIPIKHIEPLRDVNLDILLH